MQMLIKIVMLTDQLHLDRAGVKREAVRGRQHVHLGEAEFGELLEAAIDLGDRFRLRSVEHQADLLRIGEQLVRAVEIEILEQRLDLVDCRSIPLDTEVDIERRTALIGRPDFVDTDIRDFLQRGQQLVAELVASTTRLSDR